MSEAPGEPAPPDEMPPDGPPPPRRPAIPGHPVAASAIAAFVLLLSFIARLSVAPPVIADTAQRIGYLLGGAILGLIIWAIAWVSTLRRAPARWQIASLLLLAALGFALTAIDIGRRRSVDQSDISATIAKLRAATAAAPGTARFDAGPNAGPMTRLTAAAAQPVLADARVLNRAQDEAALNQLITLEGLTRDSPVLDHCDRAEAIAPLARSIATHYPASIAAARAEGETLIAEGKIDRPSLDGFVTGLRSAQAGYQQQMGLLARLAEGAADMCRILARRRWSRGDDGRVLFDNDADMREASAVRAGMEPALGQLQQMRQSELANGRSKPGQAIGK